MDKQDSLQEKERDGLDEFFEKAINDLGEIKEEEVTKEPVKEEAEEVVTVDEPVKEEVVEEFKPTYKVKVEDDEIEFDEVIKAVVKDKATEDKVRELYQKAYGIEKVKESREKFKNNYEETNKALNEYRKSVDPIVDLYEKGELYESAKAFGYTDEQILTMAKKVIEYQNATPEKRAEIDNIQKQRQESYMTRAEIEKMQTELETTKAENLRTQVTSILSTASVSETAKVVDEHFEKKGYFEKKVYEYGDMMWKKGVRLTPEQCTQALIEEYTPLVKRAKAKTEVVNSAPAKGNTIPHIKSSGTPGKKKLTSFDDYDKIIEDLG